MQVRKYHPGHYLIALYRPWYLNEPSSFSVDRHLRQRAFFSLSSVALVTCPSVFSVCRAPEPSLHSSDNLAAQTSTAKAPPSVAQSIQQLRGLCGIFRQARPIHIKILTNLLGQHVPFELGKIVHGPHIISPSRTFFSADGLGIEHLSYRASNFFVCELDPALRKMRFLRRRVLSPQISTFSVCRIDERIVVFKSVARHTFLL